MKSSERASVILHKFIPFNAQLVLVLLYVSAVNYRHLQAVTNVEDMRLSNINGKIFIHISVIP
jgi:hypothetical protein